MPQTQHQEGRRGAQKPSGTVKKLMGTECPCVGEMQFLRLQVTMKAFLLSLGTSSVYISKGELTQPLRKNSEEKGHVLAFGKSRIWPQALTLLSHVAFTFISTHVSPLLKSPPPTSALPGHFPIIRMLCKTPTLSLPQEDQQRPPSSPVQPTPP